MPDTPTPPPNELRDAVDEELAEQEAIDRSDAEPAEKVTSRDAVRKAFEAREGVAPADGPNPS